MRAFIKTLVGDAANVTVVAAVVFAEAALVWSGRTEFAAFLIPPLTIGGVAWLAWR